MPYAYNLAPKALSEQCAAFKKKYPTLDDLPFDNYVMMPKYDGCLAIVVADGTGHVLTRTGGRITSIPHVLAQARKLLPGYVIFGEAYKFDTPFKDISGAFRRHAPQDDRVVAAFDAVPVAHGCVGKCDEPYKARLARLRKAWLSTPTSSIFIPPALDLVAPQGFANTMVDNMDGYDGAILRRLDAPWMTGASKNGEAIKVKPVKSLDLRATGWFAGLGKHAGRCGGIIVEYRGVSTNVGTGFSDAEREEIAIQGTRDRIAEVEFMELTADGKLREPRFKGWRHDKEQPDQ